MFQWKNYNPPCGLSDSGPVHCLWAIFHVLVNYILLPLAFVSNNFVKINVSNFSPTLLTWYHWELKTDCPHWDSRLCSSYCFHKALEAEAGKLDINLKGVITTGSVTQGVLQNTHVFHSLLLKITACDVVVYAIGNDTDCILKSTSVPVLPSIHYRKAFWALHLESSQLSEL